MIVGTFALTVVLGQEYLPGRLGMASGVTLGAAIGVGGAFAPRSACWPTPQGIEAAMWTLAVLPLPALALGLTLPRERPARAGPSGAEDAIARVAQPRPDVGVRVELPVDGRRPDGHVGVVALDRREALRRDHQAHQREPARARLA